jgi:PAS domain S-box-containing protein
VRATRSSRLFVSLATLTAVAAAAHLLRPSSLAGDTLYQIVIWAAPFAAWLGTARCLPGDRLMRALVASGLTASALSDLGWTTWNSHVADVSLGDAFYLSSYVGLAGAVLAAMVLRGGGVRVDADAVIDALTVVVVPVLAIWSLSIHDIVAHESGSSFSHMLQAAYPVADVVLLALVLRALSSRRARKALGLRFAVGVACWLLANLGYPGLAGSATSSALLDVAWMVGGVFMATAAWRPALPVVETTKGARDELETSSPLWRLGIAIVPLLVPPGLLLLNHLLGRHIHPLQAVIGMTILAAIAYVRTARLLRSESRASAAAVSAEHALERTTQEFRSLFDYHPRAVFSIDPQRRYRRLNPAAEALSGYTEQELLSHHFPALKTEGRERVLAAFEQALKREPQRLETTLDSKDGQRRDLDISMVPIVVDEDPVGVYLLAADVTEDKRLQRELAQALTDAEQANQAKTLLIANVSHELRTPLTSVLAAGEMLADTTLDDTQQRLLAMIDRNGTSLLRLVNDLLDLTRMEVGQLSIDAVPFDLSAVLDQCVAHTAPHAAQKGLPIKVEVDEPIPPKVIGDPLRLGQVLTNLLGNAVKFTDDGEVGLRLRVQRRDDSMLDAVFRVRDTGIGIAADDQERLFGHFVQADPSSTRRYGGVGLGLAISRQLVGLMDGDLCLDSQLGVGSTFTLRIPLRLPEDA